jgi:hypothetical protein
MKAHQRGVSGVRSHRKIQENDTLPRRAVTLPGAAYLSLNLRSALVGIHKSFPTTLAQIAENYSTMDQLLLLTGQNHR